MNAPTSAADIPSKEDLLREYGFHDPLVYKALKLQTQLELTDDQAFRLLIKLLLDRHQHLNRAYQNLLNQHPLRIVTTQTVD
jgi:hypothetical protein